jgi:hypothetical protein
MTLPARDLTPVGSVTAVRARAPPTRRHDGCGRRARAFHTACSSGRYRQAHGASCHTTTHSPTPWHAPAATNNTTLATVRHSAVASWRDHCASGRVAAALPTTTATTSHTHTPRADARSGLQQLQMPVAVQTTRAAHAQLPAVMPRMLGPASVAVCRSPNGRTHQRGPAPTTTTCHRQANSHNLHTCLLMTHQTRSTTETH